MTAAIFSRLRTMPAIGEQPGHVGVVERGHPVDLEPGEGGAERLSLLQHREPRQAGLVDLQDRRSNNTASSSAGKPYSRS